MGGLSLDVKRQANSPARMQRVVSTLLPSMTGGVSRSTTVTDVDGYRFAMASAVERPNMPAPTIITVAGNGLPGRSPDDFGFGLLVCIASEISL